MILTCYQCHKPLSMYGPSSMFCTESCQHMWCQANPLIVYPAGVIPREVEQAITERLQRRKTALAIVADPTPQPGWLARARKRVFG